MRHSKEYADFVIKVCELSDCKMKYVRSKCRVSEVVRARKIIIAFRYTVLGLIQEEAVSPFGMNHCNVTKIISDIKLEYKSSKAYQDLFSEIFEKYPILVK